jgi:AraC family transcriptional regulator
VITGAEAAIWELPMMNTIASIKTSVSAVEVVRGEWPRPIELTWCEPHAVLTLLFLPSDYEVGGNYSDEEGSRQFDPIGKVFLLPPDTKLHGWGSGGKLKAVRCLFERRFYERTLGLGGRLSAAQLRSSLNLKGKLLPVLLTRLMEEALNPGASSVALALSLGTALLIECSRLICPGSEDQAPGPRLSHRQRHIIEKYIATSPAPSVVALAGLCGLSERYFCQLFRDEMGQSVGRYINTMRMGRAQNYLINTDLPLKEIAFRLGYANPSNFSFAFRENFKLEPGQFRSQHRITPAASPRKRIGIF